MEGPGLEGPGCRNPQSRVPICFRWLDKRFWGALTAPPSPADHLHRAADPAAAAARGVTDGGEALTGWYGRVCVLQRGEQTTARRPLLFTGRQCWFPSPPAVP